MQRGWCIAWEGELRLCIGSSLGIIYLILHHDTVEEFIEQLAELCFGWVVFCIVEVPQH